MFWHNFKYSFITLIKNKSLIFWTFAFPIILCLLFNMAFSNISSSEKFERIDIAVINDEDYIKSYIYKDTLNILGDSSKKESVFDITYTNLEEAKKLLEDKKIVGYIKINGNTPVIYINSNGFKETILKNIIDRIENNVNVVNNLINMKHLEAIANNEQIDAKIVYDEIIEKVSKDLTNIKNESSVNMDYTVIEFYTLIAMACLYSGCISMYIINLRQANMNHVGKRISISPIKKINLILSSLLASYIIQMMAIFLLMFFINVILGVSLGTSIVHTIILSAVGSLAGLSLGIFVASIFKVSENAKIGLLIGITMFLSFLSGMMGITLKYIIDKNVAIINLINPCSIITDGFYALYYYNTYDRYIFDVVSLLIFSIILIIISSFQLRRQQYDSI